MRRLGRRADIGLPLPGDVAACGQKTDGHRQADQYSDPSREKGNSPFDPLEFVAIVMTVIVLVLLISESPHDEPP
jgi:hypothetical protein